MSSTGLPPHPSPSGDPQAPATGPVTVRVCALTDVGRTREHNEDSFLVADLAQSDPLTFTDERSVGDSAAVTLSVSAGPDGLLFLVADGLGGAAAGEIASRMAARAVFDAMRAQLPDAGSPDPEAFALALRDSVMAANVAIHQHAVKHAELRGMGTTLTAAALRGDELFLAQVGDSRAYLLRDGVAQQLTKDQSLMQKLVEAGEITPEQAETSVRRNIILQALGPEPSVKVDLTHQPLRRGDLLILCSDGLSGQVRASEIADAAAATPEPDALCRELIARANATGGPDNITVVAARFEGHGLAAPGQDDPIGHQRYHVGTPTPDVPTPSVSAPPPPPVLELEMEAPVAPGVTPVELAERRDRARVVYVGLAVLAVVLAALLAWRLLFTPR